jgi:hypothetical protein
VGIGKCGVEVGDVKFEITVEGGIRAMHVIQHFTYTSLKRATL